MQRHTNVYGSGVAGAYDLLWLCNVVLVFAALAAFSRSQLVRRERTRVAPKSHTSVCIAGPSHGVRCSGVQVRQSDNMRESIDLADLVCPSRSHLSWNIDVLAYGAFGVFPFGTASYVIWPQTSAWEIVVRLNPFCGRGAVLHRSF